jgi:hypothetical protein
MGNNLVVGVLSLKNVATLMNGSWIEGSSGNAPTLPAIPTILSITIE